MSSLKMHKRLLSTLGRRGSQIAGSSDSSKSDSPEANVARGIRLFCESGGPNNSGEEVLHLPTIVEAAESSPAAASEAARLIRKFLAPGNAARAYVQYNAVMLIRILADNPGQSFTKNIDVKFVATVKDLLRDGRDMSVQQILRETLDNFESSKLNDETLAALTTMWRKEKAKYNRASQMGPVPLAPINGPPGNFAHQQAQQQNYFARPHRQRNALPPPAELAQRIEEARTSAKLLSQVVGTTPPQEMLANDLIKEFVERCQSASRSVQAYIHADDPPPDEDTLLTLIETNDQLAAAISRHQRALLEARKHAGLAGSATPSPNPPPPATTNNNTNTTTTTSNPTSNSLFSSSRDQRRSYTPQSNTTNTIASPPPGPPPGRKALPTESASSSIYANKSESQNPFGDQNEVPHPGQADLQAPLQPQIFGLPPQGIPGGSGGGAYATNGQAVEGNGTGNSNANHNYDVTRGGDIFGETATPPPGTATTTSAPTATPAAAQPTAKPRYRF